MTAAERIEAALSVALEAIIHAQNAGEVTVGDAAQVIDIVTAAINTVQRWAPEWETTAVEL